MEKHKNGSFNLHQTLQHIKHYLPSQAPLKDFIHHNTLHAFQHLTFHSGVQLASETFGYTVYLNLNEYRSKYAAGEILPAAVKKAISNKYGDLSIATWEYKMLHEKHTVAFDSRIGKLIEKEKKLHAVNLEKLTHPTLFRLVSSYFDQGISIWNFPIHNKSFLGALRELEQNSLHGFFKSRRARNFLMLHDCKLEHLLELLVGDECYFESYLFNLLFAHQGWSGMVSVLEENPHFLVDKRKISLHDFIVFELLLKIDLLDRKYGEKWPPLCTVLTKNDVSVFDTVKHSALFTILSLWQNAFEWSYYDSVLFALSKSKINETPPEEKTISFQAFFCIDDRECSLRRHLEKTDPFCVTYGTPGFFNVPFYFQPAHSTFYTKACPAPATPTHLLKEIDAPRKRTKDAHMGKQSHSLFSGWLIAQTIGFWSALKLFLNIFNPSVTAFAVSSTKHMGKQTKLTIENSNNETLHELKLGFSVAEMAHCIEGLLRSTGLINNFAPIVYLIGHGASSVNNTHYAGYDCGACSGRPGSVNARVAAFMANHPKVRELLSQKGIHIPEKTQFIGGLHDTTCDTISFYTHPFLSKENSSLHEKNAKNIDAALLLNANERARRFTLHQKQFNPKTTLRLVQKRAVSLFEPRPEYNHATNSLCIVGRRSCTRNLFLDRRAFLNSYDYSLDPKGDYLLGILKAAAPVCGGINLEYYFSRVDNHKLGAGTKLPHNVIGLIGVANGADGDLRPGLPSQMVEIHDPVRLLMVVEHSPDIVLSVIQKVEAVYEWFKNEWIHLVVLNPHSNTLFHFNNECFTPYTPHCTTLPITDDVSSLFKTFSKNIPVHQLN